MYAPELSHERCSTKKGRLVSASLDETMSPASMSEEPPSGLLTVLLACGVSKHHGGVFNCHGDSSVSPPNSQSHPPHPHACGDGGGARGVGGMGWSAITLHVLGRGRLVPL